MQNRKIIVLILFLHLLTSQLQAQSIIARYLEPDTPLAGVVLHVKYSIRYPFSDINGTLKNQGIFITGNDKCARGLWYLFPETRSIFGSDDNIYLTGDTTDLAFHPFPHGRYFALIATIGYSSRELVNPPLPCANGGCFDVQSSPATVNLKLTEKLKKGINYRLIFFDARADTIENNFYERQSGCNRGWDMPDYLMCGLSHATDTFAQSIIDTLLVCMPSNERWTRRMVNFTASDTFGYVGFRNYSKHYDSIQWRANALDFVQLYTYEGSASRQISKCPHEILRLQLPEGAISYEWSVKAPYTTPRIIGTPNMMGYYNSQNEFKTYAVPNITTLNGDSLNYIDVKDSGWYWCTTYLTDSTYRIDSFYVSYGIPATNNIIGSYERINICEGKSAVLTSPRNYAMSYVWSTGDTSSQIVIKNEGLFIVQSSYLQCQTYDTFEVAYTPPPGFSKDTSICEATSIVIAANASNKYQWNTGDTSQTINVNNAGTYTVKRWIENECMQIDTFNVQILPTPITMFYDTAICEGVSIMLSAQPGLQYNWNTGANTQNIIVSNAGQYSVITSIPPCRGTETFNVTTLPLPQIVTVQDTIVCFDEVKQILLDAGQFTKYLWQPTGETTRTIYSNTAQVYKLTVTDSNACVSSKDFAVMEECPYKLHVPNAFTPNGDGINDEFKLRGLRIDDIHIRIFDRWGQQVFETTDMNIGWDGKGYSDGVYTVFIEYSALGKKGYNKSTVTLLR